MWTVIIRHVRVTRHKTRSDQDDSDANSRIRMMVGVKIIELESLLVESTLESVH